MCSERVKFALLLLLIVDMQKALLMRIIAISHFLLHTLLVYYIHTCVYIFNIFALFETATKKRRVRSTFVQQEVNGSLACNLLGIQWLDLFVGKYITSHNHVSM